MERAYAFFDTLAARTALLPLTFVCSPTKLRVGIFTIEQKWAFAFGQPAAALITQPYLQPLYPEQRAASLWLNSIWLPDLYAINALESLPPGHSLWKNNVLLAWHLSQAEIPSFGFEPPDIRTIEADFPVCLLSHTWDIFGYNAEQIRYDFENIIRKNTSSPIQDSATVLYAKENIWIDPRAKIKASVLNAEAGPIYIGPDTEIQEGSLIRGPFALCQGSTLNMGAKMRSDTTIGPYCKVGGEVSNSVLMGYSNKGHDGFLGNSVIGHWCNLGADTNTSNLKNTYGNIKLYSYEKQDFVLTNKQFCGLIMADHTKAGINTMFNTGTVAGLGASVWGGGFLPKYIPSFAWGGPDDGFQEHDFEQFIRTETHVMARRNIALSKEYEAVLKYLHQLEFDK